MKIRRDVSLKNCPLASQAKGDPTYGDVASDTWKGTGFLYHAYFRRHLD